MEFFLLDSLNNFFNFSHYLFSNEIFNVFSGVLVLMLLLPLIVVLLLDL